MLDTTSPPASWYNPPELHWDCACRDCHEDHNMDEAAEYCERCADDLKQWEAENEQVHDL